MSAKSPFSITDWTRIWITRGAADPFDGLVASVPKQKFIQNEIKNKDNLIISNIQESIVKFHQVSLRDLFVIPSV
uniref:Uncharacterized protein n=1 Tax=Panagrolaimus sp. JU765 TaxID=591449 RepID=A0AC34PXA1_9BILA